MPDLFSRAFKETSLHGTVVFETRVSSHLHLPTPFNYLILNIADSCSRPASSQIPRGKMSNSTAANKDAELDPVSEQSQTLAEESEIEEATSEEIESKELKEYMTQGKRFTIFTHEQIYPQENSAMHAGDDLTARQRLGYELMAIHEHRSDVEDDEEDEE
jgi:hypothetical protein